MKIGTVSLGSKFSLKQLSAFSAAQLLSNFDTQTKVPIFDIKKTFLSRKSFVGAIKKEKVI